MLKALVVFLGIFNVGGVGGEGALKTRGREGYGKWERKGREVGVLRRQEAGEKCEMLNYALEYFQKQEPKIYLSCI